MRSSKERLTVIGDGVSCGERCWLAVVWVEGTNVEVSDKQRAVKAERHCLLGDGGVGSFDRQNKKIMNTKPNATSGGGGVSCRCRVIGGKKLPCTLLMVLMITPFNGGVGTGRHLGCSLWGLETKICQAMDRQGWVPENAVVG